MEIRSKCRFFPECWFHKVEKGANFSVFTVGFRIKEEFKISAQFQLLMLNMQSFKQKINILPSDFPFELSVFKSIYEYLFVPQFQLSTFNSSVVWGGLKTDKRIFHWFIFSSFIQTLEVQGALRDLDLSFMPSALIPWDPSKGEHLTHWHISKERALDVCAFNTLTHGWLR